VAKSAHSTVLKSALPYLIVSPLLTIMFGFRNLMVRWQIMMAVYAVYGGTNGSSSHSVFALNSLQL
jgi:hypothetical protein